MFFTQNLGRPKQEVFEMCQRCQGRAIVEGSHLQNCCAVAESLYDLHDARKECKILEGTKIDQSEGPIRIYRVMCPDCDGHGMRPINLKNDLKVYTPKDLQ